LSPSRSLCRVFCGTSDDRSFRFASLKHPACQVLSQRARPKCNILKTFSDSAFRALNCYQRSSRTVFSSCVSTICSRSTESLRLGAEFH
jgi:hypothetical protein